MTTAASVLRNLGLFGPENFAANSLIPTANTPQALQRLSVDFREAGGIDDPDIWSRYGGVMRTPQTLDEMYRLWEEMAGWDLMAAALKEFVEEAASTDSTAPGTLWYECNDKGFEDELNDTLSDLDIETRLHSQIWHVAAFGNNFEKLDYAPGEGVVGMSYVHPFEVRRFWLQRNRACIGYKWRGKEPNREDVFVGIDNSTPINRVSISDGKNIESLWYPWDMMHMRRMFRNRVSEHGEPVFDEAVGIYKKLRIALDQMVVHRAQVQPDRYAINIDTQEQPPTDQMRTVQRWKQQFRSRMSFGQGGANGLIATPEDFKAFYNPLALDTVLWVARPKGHNHSIEKLAGTTVIPDIYDVELLTDLFYSIIGMPKSWFGASKDGGSPAPSGKALLAQDIRFLRKVKSIRRPIISSYTWLGYFHAALKGKDVGQLDIKARMSEIGSLEDQLKVELLERQAAVLQTLGDVMTTYNLPREAWVDVVFKKYLHLDDEVVNTFITALPGPRQTENLGNRAPTIGRLLAELDTKVGSSAALSGDISRLKEALGMRQMPARKVLRRMRSLNDVLMTKSQSMRDGDVIIGSNSGTDVTTFNVRMDGKPTVPKPAETSSKPLQESSAEPAWRKFYQNT